MHRILFGFLAVVIGLGMVTYLTGSFSGAGGPQPGEQVGMNEPIAVVNGEPILRGQYMNQWEQRRQGFAGMSEAQQASFQGMILTGLVDSALMRGEAKKRGITVADGDTDRYIETMKQQGPDGKPLTDDQFKSILRDRGIKISQLRDDLRTSLLPSKLVERIADEQKVTEDDLLKTFDEVRARQILIAVADPARPIPGALPEAQAKRRAEQVLAKVKAGGDFGKLADEFSTDPSNTSTTMDPKTKKPATKKLGGVLGANMAAPAPGQKDVWYRRGSAGYPEEFDNALFALEKGQTSDIVRTPAGFHIVKLEDKRRELPKDFAKNKADLLKGLKQQRAAKPLQELQDQLKKTAKVEWKDPYFEWRYEYGKQGNPMMGMMGSTDPKDKAVLQEKLRAYTAKNTDDSAAHMILADMLNQQYTVAGFPVPNSKQPPMSEADKAKLRTELIQHYEAGLKRTEDRQAAFTLGRLYRENKQDDKALEHYKKMARVLGYDTDPKNKFDHMQLQNIFKEMNQPELAAQQAAKLAEIAELEKKEKARAAEASKNPGGITVTGEPGESKSVTIPGPDKANAGTKDAPAGAAPKTNP
jgi:foldase protein PrsA